MELVYLGLVMLFLISLDVLAVRFGADSRHSDSSRCDW